MDMKGLLPETAKSGDVIEVQICPIGEFNNLSEDGWHLQVCDREALKHVAEMFKEPILVDFDHASEEGEHTEAAAWIESLRFDEESGLWGSFRFTDKGAEAISGRRYRFVSPVWNTDKNDRPEKLLRVGLTNRPQIGGKPILNSVRKHKPPEVSPETPKENPEMDKLKELLGLAPESSDEDVLSAVTALKGEVEAAKAQKAEAEAEAFANANTEDETEKEALKNAYKAAPEVAKTLVNAFKAKKQPKETEIPEKPLINSMGKHPEIKTAKTPGDARAEMAALPPAERAKYFKEHCSEF